MNDGSRGECSRLTLASPSPPLWSSVAPSNAGRVHPVTLPLGSALFHRWRPPRDNAPLRPLGPPALHYLLRLAAVRRWSDVGASSHRRMPSTPFRLVRGG